MYKKQVQWSEEDCEYSGDPISLRYLMVSELMVDSHCHLDLLFKKCGVNDLSALADKVRPEGIDWNIHYVMANYVFPEQWHQLDAHVIHDGVYAPVGLHPHVLSTSRHHDIRIHTMDGLLRRPKCVGVGEVGLDYYRHQQQRECSNQRIMLAPIIHETLSLWLREWHL